MQQNNKKLYGWVIFCLIMLAYIPLGIGARKSPSDFNMPSYLIWIILSAQFAYSVGKSGFSAWRVPLAYGSGNIIFVLFMLWRGGYTMNLGKSEWGMLLGSVASLVVWAFLYDRQSEEKQKQAAKWMFRGILAVDILSFYPMGKQLWLEHPPISHWTLSGWSICLLVLLLSLFLEDCFPQKILTGKNKYQARFGDKKHTPTILEGSAFTLEQIAFIAGMLWLMVR